MKRMSYGRGFTAMELLVVLGIIALLMAIVMASISTAKRNSEIKAETGRIEQFKLYFTLFKDLHDRYPAGDDTNYAADFTSIYWVDCSPGKGCNIPKAQQLWDTVADQLTPMYTPTPYYTDTWGNPYGYDNNYHVFNDLYWTYLCSMGPNGIYETSGFLKTNPNPVAGGDDICIFMPE